MVLPKDINGLKRFWDRAYNGRRHLNNDDGDLDTWSLIYQKPLQASINMRNYVPQVNKIKELK